MIWHCTPLAGARQRRAVVALTQHLQNHRRVARPRTFMLRINTRQLLQAAVFAFVMYQVLPAK